MESELDFDSKYDDVPEFEVQENENNETSVPKNQKAVPLGEKNLDWSFFEKNKAPQSGEKTKQPTNDITITTTTTNKEGSEGVFKVPSFPVKRKKDEMEIKIPSKNEQTTNNNKPSENEL